MTIRRILLIGAPGAGKGTQAERICAKLGITQLSTGQVFRDNMARGTELGVLAKRYIEKGEFVPDEVTNPMVSDALSSEALSGGYLLDGYPRTIDQARVLDEYLEKRGENLDLVIDIEVDQAEVVARMLHRAEVEGRPDDTEPVIRHRLEVYAELTEPLIAFYAERGLLRRIDGSGTIDEVWSRIEAELD